MIPAFDDAGFRAQFTAFANPAKFPQSTLQAYWNASFAYITNPQGGCYGFEQCQYALAQNLMTAHLAQLGAMIAAGNAPGVLVSASIDKITVGIEPPPAANQWQYWLQTTPYGSQLLALLQVMSAGGYFVGGIPAQAGFKRGYGCY